MNIIALHGVEFTHGLSKGIGKPVQVLTGITLEIQKGDFVALIGRNGSGKSTLARLLNALCTPDKGSIFVHDINTSDASRLWEVRRRTGMVFSDPDTQIVGTTVEEDIAFGPENLSLPPAEILTRVQEALLAVGLTEQAERAPHLLSGGEKQRLAIAGILAMQPDCMILDEATAMLDPAARKEVFGLIRQLNHELGITVILITQQMDEALLAERILVLDNGQVAMDGTADELFSNVPRMKELGLMLPAVTELFDRLNQDGSHLPPGLISQEEALAALTRLLLGRSDHVDQVD